MNDGSSSSSAARSIAALLQLLDPLLEIARARLVHARRTLRPFRFRQRQRRATDSDKILPATIGEMPVVRRLALDETRGGIEQRAVLQNVKRRPIAALRFLVAPMPERAQHRVRARGQRPAAGDAPGLVGIASRVPPPPAPARGGRIGETIPSGPRSASCASICAASGRR